MKPIGMKRKECGESGQSKFRKQKKVERNKKDKNENKKERKKKDINIFKEEQKREKLRERDVQDWF